MRDEAERRIGHLYPKARLPDGSEATVIAWLWARTVRSPDPRAKGAMVPLVSSFMLSTKEGKKAWVEPVIDPTAPDGWRFEVQTGALAKADEERLKKGTKTARGSNFRCVLTGASIDGDHVKAEGTAGRMERSLMAIVAEGNRSRIYLSPDCRTRGCRCECGFPAWEPEGDLPDDPRNFWTVRIRPQDFRFALHAAAVGGADDIFPIWSARRGRRCWRTRAPPASPTTPPRSTKAAPAPPPTPTPWRRIWHLPLVKLEHTKLHANVTWYVDRESTMAAFGRQAIPMIWDFAE